MTKNTTHYKVNDIVVIGEILNRIKCCINTVISQNELLVVYEARGKFNASTIILDEETGEFSFFNGNDGINADNLLRYRTQIEKLKNKS